MVEEKKIRDLGQYVVLPASLLDEHILYPNRTDVSVGDIPLTQDAAERWIGKQPGDFIVALLKDRITNEEETTVKSSKERVSLRPNRPAVPVEEPLLHPELTS